MKIFIKLAIIFSILNINVYGSEEEIKALIVQLAISEQKAGDEPIFTPSKDTKQTDKRVIAYKAAEKLKSYEEKAFPYLIENINDERQSVAFRRVIPHDVGDVCYSIIKEQIFDLPEGYRGSLHREGPNGKLHPRPYFNKELLFTRSTIKEWIKSRKNKKLIELKIEAINSVLEQEVNIGFKGEEDKKYYYYPLLNKLKKLKQSTHNN